jgi:hypothetical protein
MRRPRGAKSNVTRHASRSELSEPRLEHGENIKVHMLHVLQSMSYHGARRCRTDGVMLSYEQGALYQRGSVPGLKKQKKDGITLGCP